MDGELVDRGLQERYYYCVMEGYLIHDVVLLLTPQGTFIVIPLSQQLCGVPDPEDVRSICLRKPAFSRSRPRWCNAYFHASDKIRSPLLWSVIQGNWSI